MKNKKLFVIPILILLVIQITQISLISAFFTDEHTFWSLNGLQNSPGIVSSICEGREQIVVDGNFGCDIFVIHYEDKGKVGSYISTHTRGSGYQNCMIWAGTDVDLQCFCYGIGLHNTQDHFSHTQLDNGDYGLVPGYLSKYLITNLGGHIAIEDSYDINFLKKYASNTLINNGQVKFYDQNLLDTTLFLGNDPQKNIYNKYVNLLSRMSGLTPSQVLTDANLIATGYKGQGYYTTTFKQRSELPIRYELYSLIPALIGIILLFSFIYIPFIMRRKLTHWKWLLYLFFIIIIIISILLFISFYSGNTWQWIRIIFRFIPVKVSDFDIAKYNDLIVTATSNFIKDGNLAWDDNSGLNYYDRNGVYHTGALQTSELPFYYVILPIIITILSIYFIWLVIKTIKITPIKSRFGKIFNIVGWSIFILINIMITYLLINFLFIK